MGAFTQAPRHSTSIQLNLPSSDTVCGWGWMCFLQAATTASEPRSQQGEVVQTWTSQVPTGSRLNMV